MKVQKVNIPAKFSSFHDTWSPKIVGDLNDHQVKLVRLKGEFVWHKHDHEDEMFLVIEGRFTMRFRDGDVALETGEMVIVPKGVEHLPVADREALVMLVEPGSTLNTGDAVDSRSVRDLDRI